MVFLNWINIMRVSDQNGISQACYIVEIYHSGPEPSISFINYDGVRTDLVTPVHTNMHGCNTAILARGACSQAVGL